MKRLRFGVRALRLAGVLLYGVALTAMLGLLGLFWRGDRLALRLRLTRRFHAALAAALPFRVTLLGEVPCEPRLWVGNHVSWTDIPLLGQLLPLAFLAKAEVRGWPLLGWLAEQGGTLFIRRGGGDSAKIAEQLAERAGAVPGRHQHRWHTGADVSWPPAGQRQPGRRAAAAGGHPLPAGRAHRSAGALHWR